MGLLSSFKQKPSSTRTTAATRERIQNILGVKQLDPLPALAARAFQIASDPQATATDFVETIEGDEVLSARVIRIANSVYFFRGTQATDIAKAVANIGLDELRCIISATMLKSLTKGKHPIREHLWANSVSTAIAARQLTRNVPHIGRGEAFLCGLVHDVGKLVMVQRGGSLYEKVLTLVGTGDKTFLEAEDEIYDLNHVEVGKWVAETWNFPPQAIEAIEQHHQRIPSKPGALTPALVVKLGDTFSHAAHIGHPHGFSGFERAIAGELENAIAFLQMTTDDLKRFMTSFQTQFEEEYRMYQMENA